MEQEAEENRRTLLKVELAAVVLLLHRRNLAVRSGVEGGRDLEAIAGRIAFGVSGATVQAREQSRQAGLERLRAEARSIGVRIAATTQGITSEVARDFVRARLYATNYAARWLGRARAAEGSTANAAAAANAASHSDLRRLAVTESSEAFNSGRAAKAQRVRVHELLRVWDAQLDKRTCQRCFRADGTIVGARERFPLGEPGGVHPWCRCSWTLLSPSEAFGHVLYNPFPGLDILQPPANL